MIPRLATVTILALLITACGGRPQPMGENVWRAMQHVEGERSGAR